MSRRILRMMMSSAILAAGLIVSSPFSFGKPDYMKKEKKGCTYCHNAPSKRELNEVGKCYAEHGHSLEACKKVVGAAR
jgi:hypothetical protein